MSGDIWTVDFGADPLDPEQAFSRLAVIVSDDRLHHLNLRMVIVVPGTSTLRLLPLHVVVEPDADNGLESETAFQPNRSKRCCEVGCPRSTAMPPSLRTAALDMGDDFDGIVTYDRRLFATAKANGIPAISPS